MVRCRAISVPWMLLSLSSCSWWLGVEPVLVGRGEVGGVEDAAFEARESDCGGAEAPGGGRERDPGCEAMLAQVRGERDLVGVGECVEDLAGEVALQTAQDLPVGLVFLASAVQVGLGWSVGWARRTMAMRHRALLASR